MALEFLKVGTDVKKEEAKDTLAGSFVWDTGVYHAKITKAYLGKSSGGAYNVTIELTDDKDRKLELVEYVTNREGVNFFVNKKGEKQLLPGMAKMNALAETLTGKEIGELETETKLVEQYDSTAKKRIPKETPVLVELLGKEGYFGIIKVIDFKNKEKTETKEKNELDKVFNEDKLTLAEIKAGNTEPEFFDKYVEKRTPDYVKDKTQKSGKPAVQTKTKKKAPF